MVQIQYSKKYDKKVKTELEKDGYIIHNEKQEGNKMILTLNKFPSRNKELLKKTDWEAL